MPQINYDEVISQLKAEVNTECAIANNYGIVLGSLIKEFAKGKVIPQRILELITSRKEIVDELNLENINSFALEAKDYNYLFTFSEELILISKVNLNINLATFMPSIRLFLNRLSQNSKEQQIKEFSTFDFTKEISKIEESLESDKINKDKYGIVKDLIKYVSGQ